MRSYIPELVGEALGHRAFWGLASVIYLGPCHVHPWAYDPAEFPLGRSQVVRTKATVVHQTPPDGAVKGMDERILKADRPAGVPRGTIRP